MNTARIQTAPEWPLGLLALLVIPALIIEERAASPWLRQAAVALNWTIWLAFCADFVVRWLADPRLRFLREGWFDLALILITPPFLVPESLQGARVLRLLRLIRAGGMAGIGLRSARRAFGPRQFHQVAMVAAMTVLLGADGVFLFEHGRNASIETFDDAL